MRKATFCRRPGWRSRGFAIGYLMFALTMIGLLSVAAAGTAGRHQRFRTIEDHAAVVGAQFEQIRNALNICVTVYPTGDNGTGFHVKYPAGSTAVAASGLDCPGNPGGVKNIFQGQNGGFLDPLPNGFGAWSYVNDASGIKVSVTSSGDGDRNISLSRAAAKFSQASVTGNTLTIWILVG